MCGIVGYITTGDKVAESERDWFLHHALVFDSIRGMDSTGIISLSKRFTVNTLKNAVPGHIFVENEKFSSKKYHGWAVIGHNRAATAGKVNTNNAHPFMFEHVTLVHNGTLVGGGRNLSTFDDKLPVDSMQIGKALDSVPPEKAKDVLEQINGSFTLAWVDLRDESINLARNPERPLHFCYNANKNFLMFMSDGHMLSAINKSFGNSNFRGETIFSLDSMKQLKFRKGKLVPEVTTFRPFQHPVVVRRGTWRPGMTSGTPSQRNERSQNTRTSIGPSNAPLIMIGDEKKRIPPAHVKQLMNYFSLTPFTHLEFKPETIIETPQDRRVNVFGKAQHEAWGRKEYETLLFNIPIIQANAYKDTSWTITPIGVGKPALTNNNFILSIIGRLVQCDWDRWCKTHQKYDPMTDQTLSHMPGHIWSHQKNRWVPNGDKKNSDVMLGPDGQLIARGLLKSRTDKGCVTCKCKLNVDDVHTYFYVDNRQAVVCVDCLADESYDAMRKNAKFDDDGEVIVH